MGRRSTSPAQTVEAVAVAAAGAALGWYAGGVVHQSLGLVMAIVAAANGAVSGWRGVYVWRSGWGVIAFAVDSTWASLSTAAGLIAHVIAAVRRPAGYEASLSVRQNRHVYRAGAHFQRGFALTIGNVISSAGDVDRPRRRKLITDHEAVHVWQSRTFGPLYLPLYALWSLGGVVVGVFVWLWRRRRDPLGSVVESCSYYTNPFEWWAYSRDDLWPPPKLLAGIGWRRPAVRPLAEVRAARAHRHE